VCPRVSLREDFRSGWSLADLSLAIRLCVHRHNVYLADDLAVGYLQRCFDPHPTAVRVLARFPERHAVLADDLPLDAVRRPLAEGRSQVLGDLRLSAKLEGRLAGPRR
jgi:hypothetical protein